MQRVRNRLLIAMVLVVAATCACLHARAEASSYGLASGGTALSAVKVFTGTYSGEPDSGDSGKTPRTSGGSGSGNNGSGGNSGVVVPAPSGNAWIIPVWAMRYLAVGW